MADFEALCASAEARLDACLGAEGEEAQRAAAPAALEALAALKGCAVTVELLSACGAGKRLKKATKTLEAAGAGCADVAAEVRRVVEEWRRAVTEQAGGAAAAAETPKEAEREEQPAAKRPKLESLPSTGSAARDKHRDLLVAALQVAAAEGVEGDSLAVGAEVERALYDAFLPGEGGDRRDYAASGGASSKDYKAKFRQLSFNLKDSKNRDLRRAVLSGQIDPPDLVFLSAEELGSEERRLGNQKIREHAMWECERGQKNVASTDQFQCGKCKQRKCTYFQMQTRSADEPMTTFVTCTVCNARWKFC